MHIFVHVGKRCLAVSCGDGTQPVRWLADVGQARHDENLGRSLGIPTGVRLEDGQKLTLTQDLVSAGLKDRMHVWVLFKDSAKSDKDKSGGKTSARGSKKGAAVEVTDTDL